MIQIVKVRDKDEGNKKARDILKDVVDSKTLLALSGGTSPDYRKMIVEPGDILPGAVCVVDERFGKPFHKDSNELLLKDQGVVDFLRRKKISFYNFLKGKEIEQTAGDFEKVIVKVFAKFLNKVGVMGVGSNLHTAGIFPNSEAGKWPNFVSSEVVDDKYPVRVTLTLRALGEFNNFIILLFGSAKQEALKKLLDEGENDMQKYPAIFYRKCKAKSYLITDCDI